MQKTYSSSSLSSLAAFAATMPTMTGQQALDTLAALVKLTEAGGVIDHAKLTDTAHQVVGEAPVTAAQQLSAQVSSDRRARLYAHFGIPQ